MKLLSALALLLLAGVGVAFFARQMREDDEPLTEQMKRVQNQPPHRRLKVRWAKADKRWSA